MSDPADRNKPIIIKPGEGRVYAMGRMSAIFKADGVETNSRLSVSEWWLDADTAGPHVHSHPEDHLFYVLEGTVSVLIEDTWRDAVKGTYIYIPGGHQHSFENRGNTRAGFMSINTPGGFETSLPAIVQWFAEYPLSNAGS